LPWPSEGVDWVLTARDVAAANNFQEAAIASFGFLPFVSGGSIKIFSNNRTKLLFECSSEQARKVQSFVTDFQSQYKGVKVFNSSVVLKNGTVVIQRSDLPLSRQNIILMSNGNAPFMKNANGKDTRVQLHHVEKQVDGVSGVLAELRDFENTSSNALHNYPYGGVVYDKAWESLKAQYWKDRLQQAINNLSSNAALRKQLTPSIIADLKSKGFVFP